MFVVKSTITEDKNEEPVLSGTFIVEDQEIFDIGNCRLYLDILKLFNNAKHCAIPEVMETVIFKNNETLVTTTVAEEMEIQGWVYKPIAASTEREL